MPGSRPGARPSPRQACAGGEGGPEAAIRASGGKQALPPSRLGPSGLSHCSWWRLARARAPPCTLSSSSSSSQPRHQAPGRDALAAGKWLCRGSTGLSSPQLLRTSAADAAPLCPAPNPSRQLARHSPGTRGCVCTGAPTPAPPAPRWREQLCSPPPLPGQLREEVWEPGRCPVRGASGRSQHPR